MADLTVERASIIALKTYLEAELSSVNVLDWWPGDETLKSRTISIIPAGPREEIHSTPRVVGVTDVSPTEKDYTWRIMAIAQPIQIDVWEGGPDAYSVAVDELLQELEVALHQGLGNANSLAKSNADPFRDGVLLNLDPSLGHVGTVDVITQDVTRNDTEDAVLRREWRATIRGELRTALELTARSVRMLQMILKMRIGTGPLATNPEEIYTFNATS